jgi:3-hydroxyacyl-[acyl-carrier-protein] dehydratase
MSGRSIDGMLPHRPPFLFVTELLSADTDHSRATWRVDGHEPFLTGHFPGNPIVPGVLVAEALAQSAGLVIGCRSADSGRSRLGFLAKVDLKFPSSAKPPCDILLSARCTHELGSLYRFDVTASAGDTTIATGEIVLSVPIADPIGAEPVPEGSGTTPR